MSDKYNLFFKLGMGILLFLCAGCSTLQFKSKPYNFKVVGHAYPLITQLKDVLKNEKLVIFTGDMVFDGCTDWPKFFDTASVIKKWYIAAGNHDKDILCPDNYPDTPLFQEFYVNGDQFIILDSVEYNWSIKWEQRDKLITALDKPARNRFIFTHNAIHINEPEFCLDKVMPTCKKDLNNDWLPNSLHGHSENLTYNYGKFSIRSSLEASNNIFLFMGDYGNRNNGHNDEIVNGVRYIGAGLSARNKAEESGYSSIRVSQEGIVSIEHIVMKCDLLDEDRARISVCD